MINKIAETGICDFTCHKCKLEEYCVRYNDRHNDDIDLNQVEKRKEFAADYLKEIERFADYAESVR